MLVSVVVTVICAIAGATAEISKLAIGSNTFAKDMYLQMTKKNDGQNILFAPLGLSMAMAMVYNGATDRTARQIYRTMFFDSVSDDKEELNRAIHETMRLFKRPTNQYTLSIANKLFGSRKYEYNRDFQQVLREEYGAPLEKIDMETDVKDAVMHINNWVAERTNMKVTDMLKEGDITANMSMALISAFYFRGVWEESFPKEDTKERPFLKGGTENIDVKTMYTEGNYSYKAMSDLKSNVLEIPYQGNTVSMFIVLPWNRTHGLEELETFLKSFNSVDDIFENLHLTSVKISLPLLSLDKCINLAGNLTVLGVDDLFAEKFAQLGGITSDPEIHVSTALHKTMLNVSETGRLPREPFNRTTNASHSAEPQVFVNHPFMFFVREKTTGAILQMGRVVDPSAGAPQSVVVSFALVAIALLMSFA